MSNTAEQRFLSAIERLKNGKPERVKASGKITLNKINREAGFGHSYIQNSKFKTFVSQTVNPLIKEYNEKLDSPDSVILPTSLDSNDTNEIEKLKNEKRREQRLKDKYRKERDDLEVKLKELETLNNSLTYRVYELQIELQEALGNSVYEIKGENGEL